MVTKCVVTISPHLLLRSPLHLGAEVTSGVIITILTLTLHVTTLDDCLRVVVTQRHVTCIGILSK